MSDDHQPANVAKRNQRDDNVAVDAVEQNRMVADCRYELPNHENTSWNDCAKMEGDADAIVTTSIPVPLSRCRSFRPDVCDIQGRELIKTEAKHSTCKNENCGNISKSSVVLVLSTETHTMVRYTNC